MSALAEDRAAKPSQAGATETKPALAAVPPARPSRMPFLVVVALIGAGGMAGMVMLQTAVQQQSFEVRHAQAKAAELGYKQAQLQGEVDLKTTPAELMRRASELGMRPNPYPVYIDLRNGQVVGVAKPVQGTEMPLIDYKSPEQISSLRQSAPVPDPAAAQPGDSQPQR